MSTFLLIVCVWILGVILTIPETDESMRVKIVDDNSPPQFANFETEKLILIHRSGVPKPRVHCYLDLRVSNVLKEITTILTAMSSLSFLVLGVSWLVSVTPSKFYLRRMNKR